MHYCGDTLVDTALFYKAKTCGMQVQNSALKTCTISKKNCCNDKQLVVDGLDELKTSVDEISLTQQFFISSFIYTYQKLFNGYDKNIVAPKDYIPPLVVRQIYKLDQTYLI
jgi:hypothetical protein